MGQHGTVDQGQRHPAEVKGDIFALNLKQLRASDHQYIAVQKELPPICCYFVQCPPPSPASTIPPASSFLSSPLPPAPPSIAAPCCIPLTRWTGHRYRPCRQHMLSPTHLLLRLLQRQCVFALQVLRQDAAYPRPAAHHTPHRQVSIQGLIQAARHFSQGNSLLLLVLACCYLHENKQLPASELAPLPGRGPAPSLHPCILTAPLRLHRTLSP